MRESALEKKIVEYAEAIGYLAYKFVSPGNKGVPDQLFISPQGRVMFIEVKAPGETPNALQLREIRIINEQGGHACWHDSFDSAKAILDLLADGNLR